MLYYITKSEVVNNKKRSTKQLSLELHQNSESTNNTSTCDCETNRKEKTSINYDNEGDKNTLGTPKKEETINAWHEETGKSSKNYINIYECGQKYLPLNLQTCMHRN